MIDGKTQLVGLIGWPVEHSLSPVMHNAAFDTLGLNWRYVPLPVPPGQVEAAVRGLAALGFHGANVTVPYKETVLETLDDIAPEATALGAVNTIVLERETGEPARVRGHNTDAPGFIEALRQGGFEPEGCWAVIMGAGGAARAVVYGLLQAGSHDVTVLNRTFERAKTLVIDMDVPEPAELHTSTWNQDSFVRATYRADLLVNATPVGMWPHVEGSIWPDQHPIPDHLVVFDLVYNPRETRLLRQARQAGARAIGGLEMLVQQGARAFSLWTGEAAPVDVMRTACERAMRR